MTGIFSLTDAAAAALPFTQSLDAVHVQYVCCARHWLCDWIIQRRDCSWIIPLIWSINLISIYVPLGGIIWPLSRPSRMLFVRSSNMQNRKIKRILVWINLLSTGRSSGLSCVLFLEWQLERLNCIYKQWIQVWPTGRPMIERHPSVLDWRLHIVCGSEEIKWCWRVMRLNWWF